MRLGQNGASLELDISGYQFPDLMFDGEPIEHSSWDANWLIVAGEARTAEGRSWSFRDPALTTWEAAELIGWLRAVVAGDVPATATPEGPDVSGKTAGWLTFTEPNLSFAVQASEGSRFTLLVGLGNESAAPPVLPRRSHRNQIALITDARQLEDSALCLDAQLANYPAR